MNYDDNFLTEFNEYYPFERLILKEPVQINYLFDDVYLTEIFVPSTEIKPIVDDNGRYIMSTEVNKEAVYVKLKTKSGNEEFRFSYFDFSEWIREDIRNAVINDFGDCEWQDLYVETEDLSYLKNALLNQNERITSKYGECNVKKNFKMTSTIELLK